MLKKFIAGVILGGVLLMGANLAAFAKPPRKGKAKTAVATKRLKSNKSATAGRKFRKHRKRRIRRHYKRRARSNKPGTTTTTKTAKPKSKN